MKKKGILLAGLKLFVILLTISVVAFFVYATGSKIISDQSEFEYVDTTTSTQTGVTTTTMQPIEDLSEIERQTYIEEQISQLHDFCVYYGQERYVSVDYDNYKTLTVVCSDAAGINEKSFELSGRDPSTLSIYSLFSSSDLYGELEPFDNFCHRMGQPGLYKLRFIKEQTTIGTLLSVYCNEETPNNGLVLRYWGD